MRLALVAATYYLLLSTLWLLLGVLYAVQLRWGLLASFVIGILTVAALQGLAGVPIQIAHWVGLGTADLSAGLWAWMALSRRVRGAAGNARLARLPRPALLVHAALPYWGYGVLYFAFLFVDRTVAWSGGDDPLPLWFDTPYEIGLDFALLVLVLTLPQLEYTVHEFAASIGPVQESRPGEHMREHNLHFLRFYVRQVGLLAVLVVVSAALVTSGLVGVAELDHAPIDTSHPVTEGVYAWGVIAYGLLVLSLLNGVFLFSLSRPRVVIQALLLALVVNAGLGWWLSRNVDYWFAVVGLAAGTLVFAVITTGAAAAGLLLLLGLLTLPSRSPTPGRGGSALPVPPRPHRRSRHRRCATRSTASMQPRRGTAMGHAPTCSSTVRHTAHTATANSAVMSSRCRSRRARRGPTPAWRPRRARGRCAPLGPTCAMPACCGAETGDRTGTRGTASTSPCSARSRTSRS